MSGSKRKIAVTGATGLIGGALVRLLAGESGLQVVEAAAPSSSLKTSEAAHRCTLPVSIGVRFGEFRLCATVRMETVPARLAHPQRRGFMRYHLEEAHMRIPFISPAELNSDQRPLYDDMRIGIEKNFRGFIAVCSTGQLIGPWAPWIRFPKFGRPVWELLKALSSTPTLTRSVREIAILVVGAAFRSGYEIYAHANVAELTGFSEERIATISAGQRPADLTREEAVAFDIASALVSGGVLPEPTYQQAVRLFGDDSTAELMYLIGFYCLVSVCLNGFDVPVPEVNARY